VRQVQQSRSYMLLSDLSHLVRQVWEQHNLSFYAAVRPVSPIVQQKGLATWVIWLRPQPPKIEPTPLAEGRKAHFPARKPKNERSPTYSGSIEFPARPKNGGQDVFRENGEVLRGATLPIDRFSSPASSCADSWRWSGGPSSIRQPASATRCGGEVRTRTGLPSC
jgi:hypothetical protein